MPGNSCRLPRCAFGLSRYPKVNAERLHIVLTLIQPKGPTPVNKALVDVPPGGIWVWRFTAPKYLRSMVAMPKIRMGVMKSEQSALHVRGLTKRFDRLAVDALDLTVRTGEFYALVGPNGAGKTTTLRMVAGLARPDAGSVAVFGIDALREPVAAKQVMAWVSDEPDRKST